MSKRESHLKSRHLVHECRRDISCKNFLLLLVALQLASSSCYQPTVCRSHANAWSWWGQSLPLSSQCPPLVLHPQALCVATMVGSYSLCLHSISIWNMIHPCVLRCRVRCRDSQVGEASERFSLFSDWLSILCMEEVHRTEPLSSLPFVPVCEKQIFLSCSL